MEFHPLISCSAFVYLWKNHPLAKKDKINLEDLLIDQEINLIYSIHAIVLVGSVHNVNLILRK